MRRRYELSTRQWQRLIPLLPHPRHQGGRGHPWLPHHRALNGILWVLHTGAPWRDVPERYGPWQTVYDRFRRWKRDGTWARVLSELQAVADAAGLVTWDVSVDSTVARAHQHAAGARKRGICRRNHPTASAASSRLTTRWAGRGVAGPRSCTWAASRASHP